jgi:hypothetical protein
MSRENTPSSAATCIHYGRRFDVGSQNHFGVEHLYSSKTLTCNPPFESETPISLTTTEMSNHPYDTTTLESPSLTHSGSLGADGEQTEGPTEDPANGFFPKLRS